MRKTGLLGCCLALLSACGGEGDDSGPDIAPPADCSIATQNQWLYGLMQDLYYWHEQVPVLDPLAYDSPDALLAAILARVPQDRFSFIIDAELYHQRFDEAQLEGLGLRYRFEDDNLLLLLVYPDSPAAQAGLARGDRILAANGISIADRNQQGLPFLDDNSAGTPVQLQVRKPDGREVSLTAVNQLFTLKTVLASRSWQQNGLTLGYLALSNFYAPTADELTQAFASFASQSLDELILDLRYNGGGRLNVAQQLASLIAGEPQSQALFAQTQFNQRYSGFNQSYLLQNLTNNLGLRRLIVLTSSQTCSASEAVMAGLSPFIQVVSIGGATCGKPVGSSGVDFCGKRAQPISFQLANSTGLAEYFAGLPFDCAAEDDPSRPLGDPAEGQLATALHWLENGTCPAPVAGKLGAPEVQSPPFNGKTALGLEDR